MRGVMKELVIGNLEIEPSFNLVQLLLLYRIPFIFAANWKRMLQVAFIRNNTELVKSRLAIKNFKEIELLDEIIGLDDERKRLQLDFDTTQSKVNGISKEIGQLMARGQKVDAENKKK